MRNIFKLTLYVIGMVFDVVGLLLAVISPDFGLKLGGVVLVMCGVAVMKLSNHVRGTHWSGTDDFDSERQKDPSRKSSRFVLSTILLAIILIGAALGILVAQYKHNNSSLTFFSAFCAGIVLLTFVFGIVFRSKEPLSYAAKYFKSKQSYKLATAIQVFSVMFGILSFILWRRDLFYAVELNWPLYSIGSCSILLIISTGYKIYSLLRNTRLW